MYLSLWNKGCWYKIYCSFWQDILFHSCQSVRTIRPSSSMEMCTGVFPLQARLWPRGWVDRGIALLFHDHGTRRGWVVSSTPRPHFNHGKDPVHIVLEVGWAPGPVWRGGKSLLPPGFDPRTVQPVVSHYTDWATRPSSMKHMTKFYVLCGFWYLYLIISYNT